RVPAEFGGAQRAPGDPVARAVQATERSLETFDARQAVLLGYEDIVENDLARDRRAQAEFAFDLRSREALHSLFENEAADHAVVRFGPHDENIGDRRIGNPHLG